MAKDMPGTTPPDPLSTLRVLPELRPVLQHRKAAAEPPAKQVQRFDISVTDEQEAEENFFPATPGTTSPRKVPHLASRSSKPSRSSATASSRVSRPTKPRSRV